MITTRQDLARAIEDIGCRQEEPGGQIAAIIETFNQLLLPEPVTPKRRIGSNPDENAPQRVQRTVTSPSSMSM
jgi:hypothetical protein